MKMTKVAVALLLSTCIITPAFAQSTTSVNITAQVDSSCRLSASPDGGDPSRAIVLAVDANTGKHAGVAEATPATTRSMRLACNQPFMVNLISEQGAVRRSSEASGAAGVDTPVLGGTMAKAIGYSATPRLLTLDEAFAPTYTPLIAKEALASGATPETQVSAANVITTSLSTENSGGAYDGILEIGIATDPSETLVAGSYRDTLQVVIIAQ